MSWYKKRVLPWLIDSFMQSEYESVERQKYVPAARGVVLEVGAGSATNVPFYSSDVTQLYALEPSQELWQLGQERVAAAKFPIQHLHTQAESILLPDASVDTVVTGWALCSLEDPSRALKEMHRVLRPGGQYIFIDHGMAPDAHRHALQSVLNPFSICCTGNCHLTRKIDGLIKGAGFTIESIEKGYIAKSPLLYLYRGRASK